MLWFLGSPVIPPNPSCFESLRPVQSKTLSATVATTPTKWGPLTTISGFIPSYIPSYTHLQPWLNRVCWGYNYLVSRGAPSCIYATSVKDTLLAWKAWEYIFMHFSTGSVNSSKSLTYLGGSAGFSGCLSLSLPGFFGRNIFWRLAW